MTRHLRLEYYAAAKNWAEFKCLKRPPRQVDVVSCVGLDYLLEKLRRSLCYAGDIITPLQQPCYGLLRRRRRRF